jgi:SEC-C motif
MQTLLEAPARTDGNTATASTSEEWGLDVPPRLEETDPQLAEGFRLVANGQHPTIQSISASEGGITLGFKDGSMLSKSRHFRIHTSRNGRRTIQTPERNEACWCGSGQKYKKCCFVK